GTGRGRLAPEHSRRVLTLHGVQDGAGDHRHAEEVLLGLLYALGDGGRHLLGLAVADADPSLAVAHNHQAGEAEATATLDDLGHTVDGDHVLKVSCLLVGFAAGTVGPALG